MSRHLAVTASLLLVTALAGAQAQAQQRYSFSLLAPLAGGVQSGANGLNELGQVVGSTGFGDDGPAQATRWKQAVPAALPGLGGPGASVAQGVNLRGWVAGKSLTVQGDTHATLWKNGVATDLGTLGGRTSIAYAVNANGLVVGFSNFSPSDPTNSHATMWQGSSKTDLGTLGGSYSGAYAVNAAGQVAGQSAVTGNVAVHAVRWTGGVPTDLGPGYGYGINDAGDVVGSNCQTATWWQNDTPVDLGTLGGSLSQATDINNAGQIVGYSLTLANAASHAVLWHDGAATDLNSVLSLATRQAGWVLANAAAINENGWITGTAFNTLTGAQSAYLLKPKPTPASR
jgi:probable HAF family extracellular repeat protein